MATVRLKGWFKPKMAAQINQRDDATSRHGCEQSSHLNARRLPRTVRLTTAT